MCWLIWFVYVVLLVDRGYEMLTISDADNYGLALQSVNIFMFEEVCSAV